MNKCATTLLLLILFFDFGFSVQHEVDPEILKLVNSIEIDSAMSNSGAVILLKESYTKVDKNKLPYSTLHVIGKILDKKAKQDYSQIPIFFNSYYSEVSLKYARTIKPDGKVINVSQDAVQIKDLPSDGAISYSDRKFLSFSLAGIDIGSVFEFKISYQDIKPYIKNYWCDSYDFNYVLHSLIPPYTPRIDPVVKSIQTLEVLKDEKFKIFLENIDLENVKTSDEKYDRYIWEIENLPAVKIEYGMPYLYDQVPNLHLSSLDSWEVVGKWAYKKINPKIIVTPEIMAHAIKITDGLENEEKKIEAIYSFIQDKIEYVQADLMRGGYIPHFSYETLTNRYGDCKDQATLLLALLKAIGIEAYPALLNAFPSGKIKRNFPNPYFNHLIVYIPREDGDIWLDTTSDVTPYNRLFVSDQDRLALIVKNEGSEFIQTPLGGLAENYSEVEINFEFYGDTIKTKIDLQANGGLGDYFKALFLLTDEVEKKTYVNDFLDNFNKNAINQEYKFLNIDNNNPFRLEISFTNDNVWKRSLFYFTFSAHTYFSIPTFLGLETLPLPDDRQHDFQFSMPTHLKNREIYPPPVSDFHAIQLPENYHFSSDYLEFNKTFTKQNDTVIVDWDLMLKNNLVAAKDYAQFYDDAQEIIKQIDWKVKFQKDINIFVKQKEPEAEKFRISAIVVANETDAKKIKEQIKQGVSFKSLAKEHSIGPGKDKGGDLGYFAKGDLFEALDIAAKDLQLGDVSDIINTSTGFFIIKKTDILKQKEIIELSNFEDLINTAKKHINSKKFQLAINVLEKALKSQALNQEVNYLLGYCHMMQKLSDARNFNNLIHGNLKIAANYFIKVLEISPYYNGKIINGDPYTHLSNIFGSLAFSYLINSKIDSMKWAFKTGTKYGAFSASKLELFKNALLSCSSNSLFFTDINLHYYIYLYLQQLNQIKKDVTVVNLNFLKYPWYVLSLKHDLDHLGYTPISLDDKLINNPKPKLLESQYYQIPVTNDIMNVMGKIKWQLKLKGNSTYLPFQDVVFLNILETNKWEKPLFFSICLDSTQYLGLHKYLLKTGLVNELITHEITGPSYSKIMDNMNQVYTYKALNDTMIRFSPDLKNSLNLYRIFYFLSWAEKNKDPKDFNIDKFINTITNAERNIPSDLLPYPAALEIQFLSFRAFSYVYDGKYNEFLSLFKKIKNEELSIPILLAFADILKLKDKTEKAIYIYENITKTDNASWKVYRNIGQCYEKLKQYDKAIENYNSAIELEPDNAYLYNDLAYTYMEAHIYNKSIVYYKKSVALKEDFVNSWGNLGWVYYLNGDFKESIISSNKAVSLDSSALYARYNIPLAYLKSGQVDKAKTLYKEAKDYNLSIQDKIHQGAIDDLRNLIKENIQVEESKIILKTIFNFDVNRLNDKK